MLSRNIHMLSSDYFSGEQPDEKRRGGRFPMVGVGSNLGRVLDLSHCGALIVKRRFRRLPMMASFPVRVRYDELTVTVVARLARRTKVKGVGKVLGLEFLDVTDRQRETIKQIIQRSRRWNVLPEDQDAA